MYIHLYKWFCARRYSQSTYTASYIAKLQKKCQFSIVVVFFFSYICHKVSTGIHHHSELFYLLGVMDISVTFLHREATHSLMYIYTCMFELWERFSFNRWQLWNCHTSKVIPMVVKHSICTCTCRYNVKCMYMKFEVYWVWIWSGVPLICICLPLSEIKLYIFSIPDIRNWRYPCICDGIYMYMYICIHVCMLSLVPSSRTHYRRVSCCFQHSSKN